MLGYSVVRTDNMAGSDVREALVSIEYLGADGATPTAIENGNVLKVGALKEGEREIYIGGDVAVDDALSDVVLVATPELVYDERLRDLDDFINEAGRPCRGYRLHKGGVFSVTKGALAGAETPAVGDVVEFAEGTKLSVAASGNGATEGSTVVGTIIAVDVVGKYTYYAIRIG